MPYYFVRYSDGKQTWANNWPRRRLLSHDPVSPKFDGKALPFQIPTFYLVFKWLDRLKTTQVKVRITAVFGFLMSGIGNPTVREKTILEDSSGYFHEFHVIYFLLLFYWAIRQRFLNIQTFTILS